MTTIIFSIILSISGLIVIIALVTVIIAITSTILFLLLSFFNYTYY